MTDLGALSFPSARALLAEGAVGLLPVGATEAHGPHLPLDTDVRIATATAARAAPRIAEVLGLEAVVLPPIAYSVTEYAAPFAGTIGVPAEAARAYLGEVLKSAARQGFRALCAVNAHLEPAHRHVLRDAVKAARRTAACPVTIADPCDRRFVDRLTDELRSGKCHAGQYETSILLAAGVPVDRGAMRALPEVDVDLVAGMQAGLSTFPEMGANEAYFGTPAAATAAEGHDTLNRLAQIVVEVLSEGLNDPTLKEPTESSR